MCLTREIYKDRTSQLVKKRFQRSRPSPPTPGYEGVELASLPQTPCALTFECGTSFTDAVHSVSNSTCEGEDVLCLQVLLGTFSSSTVTAAMAGRQQGAGGRFSCRIFYFVICFSFFPSLPHCVECNGCQRSLVLPVIAEFFMRVRFCCKQMEGVR